MPAKSKSQQRFFGMVHACQKTGDCASSKIKKVAGDISHKDADDFASTKHKGLPEKKQEYTEYGVYKCPHCGGEALNGIPEKGMRFRGSAQCRKCDETFSAIHMKPIGTLHVNENFPTFKEWMSTQAPGSEMVFG